MIKRWQMALNEVGLFFRKSGFLSLAFAVFFFCFGRVYAQGILLSPAESLCVECTISVKNVWEITRYKWPSLQVAPENRQGFLVLAFSLADSLREQERIGIRNSRLSLEVTPFGRRLFDHVRTYPQLRFSLYHQYRINPMGQSSLHDSELSPLFIKDRKDIQDLFGFFRQLPSGPVIFLNNYQLPGYAKFTLGHELMHLFDEKTRIYSEQMKDEWHLLDKIAVEARAILAELTIFKQSQFQNKEELSSVQHLMRLLDRSGEINEKEFERYLLDLFLPNQSKATTSIDSEGVVHSYRVRGNWSTGYRLEPMELNFMKANYSFLDLVFEFFRHFPNSLEGAGVVSFLTAPLKALSPQNLESWSQQARNELYSEVRQRGASSIVGYLKIKDLLSDFNSGLLLRSEGINTYLHSQGGPSPRIGGGTFLKNSEGFTESTSSSKYDLRGVEKKLNEGASGKSPEVNLLPANPTGRIQSESGSRLSPTFQSNGIQRSLEPSK